MHSSQCSRYSNGCLHMPPPPLLPLHHSRREPAPALPPLLLTVAFEAHKLAQGVCGSATKNIFMWWEREGGGCPAQAHRYKLGQLALRLLQRPLHISRLLQPRLLHLQEQREGEERTAPD